MHLYGHQLELPSPQKNYLTQVPTISWDGSRLMSGWLKTIKADFLCLNLRQLCHPSSKALHTIRSSLRHYRSVFLVAHSCEFIFFFFSQLYLQRDSTTNHLYSVSESVPSEHDLKCVAYSKRTQGESPWMTKAKDKTAIVLISSSGKALALSFFSTLNILTHLTSSVYTLFSTLTCLISFFLQELLFISFCCFKIFESQF